MSTILGLLLNTHTLTLVFGYAAGAYTWASVKAKILSVASTAESDAKKL